MTDCNICQNNKTELCLGCGGKNFKQAKSFISTPETRRFLFELIENAFIADEEEAI